MAGGRGINCTHASWKPEGKRVKDRGRREGGREGGTVDCWREGEGETVILCKCHISWLEQGKDSGRVRERKRVRGSEG